MPPRRRGRGRGQFQQESEGQNDDDQRSITSRRRTRQVEDEVYELAAPVDDMELVMVRFQRMNPQTFNGDEPSDGIGPDPHPGRQRKNKNFTGMRSIRIIKTVLHINIHRVFSRSPVWHLCLAPTGVSRTRRFSVDCGRFVNPVHDQTRGSFVRLH
ncbi:mediator of RNA polymerase II transcription subunit 17-like [Dorcoceras hygrometricum]|uniref:Mediator of RNA polymerase II transcription subunit 17-like n=1 Tax=Dorcoceras hygrometricum TaxID=472368 RepID=A0A2Z6ZSM1_9LAMI|nr:mediator of RNA polymerase II transcription subunit 17-like [Dorcoceras hygrometricum]